MAVFFITDGEITNNDSLESFSKASKYIDYGAVLGYGTKEGGKMYPKSDYNTEITISGRIIKSRLDEMQQILVEKTCGRIKMEIIGKEFGF